METARLAGPTPRFVDLFDLSEIQRLQDAFAATHRVASVITDQHGIPITRPSRFTRLCGDVLGVARHRGDALACWTGPPGCEVGHCPVSGLWRTAAGITVGGVRLATWFAGQIRAEEDGGPESAAGADAPGHAAALAEVPVMSRARFTEVCGLLHLSAELISRQGERNARLQAVVAEKERIEAERDQLRRSLREVSGTETVGRLAGGIAHDFGNLLTAISGYAEMMSDALDVPDDPKAPPNRILAASERAGALVQQLLDLSRRRSGSRETVDLRGVIADAAALLERTLPRTVRLTCDLPPTPVAVLGDVANLSAALLNLGINAGHAMPGGGLLQFSLRDRWFEGGDRDCAPGRYAEILVSDTGVGMDAATVGRIFDPFFTTREAGAGTGLGLTRVRNCVLSHGGELDVSSEPGLGTVFSLRLPLLGAERRRCEVG